MLREYFPQLGYRWKHCCTKTLTTNTAMSLGADVPVVCFRIEVRIMAGCVVVCTGGSISTLATAAVSDI